MFIVSTLTHGGFGLTEQRYNTFSFHARVIKKNEATQMDCFVVTLLAMTCKMSSPGLSLQFSGDFFLGITLDDVADFDIVEVLDVQTAVHTGGNLLHVVLEALQ